MGVATNVYLRKTLEKPKRGLRILKRRVWELFTYKECISTPRVYQKGQLPLIKCAKNDFKIIYFTLFGIIFVPNRQGCCPCSYVSLGATRKSDRSSSLSKNVHVFLKDFILNTKKKVVKVLDLETTF